MQKTIGEENILLSIQPFWSGHILNWVKEYEFRKNYPRFLNSNGTEPDFDENNVLTYEKPVKVYIYCTKTGEQLYFSPASNKYECVSKAAAKSLNDTVFLNSKIVGTFMCDKIVKVTRDTILGMYSPTDAEKEAVEKSCINHNDMLVYVGSKEQLYAWHISELTIFDEPLSLEQAYSGICKHLNDTVCIEKGLCPYKQCTQDGDYSSCFIPIETAPQNWCYVKGLIKEVIKD